MNQDYQYQDKGARTEQLRGVRRVVIKIGTRLLMDSDGVSPAARVGELVHELSELRRRGIQVVLVSSGAIGAGILVLETKSRPKKMAALQAHAAVGQCHLMALYEQSCEKEGFHCAQLLLTAADLHDRERHVKVAQCVEELLSEGVLPIINENDSVCVDEIKVGDNDTLAALVASMCRADLTVLLTTIDGLHERLEEKGDLGPRISVVHEISPRIIAMAGGTDGNIFSTGGMATKLQAARMATCCGDALWIADGSKFTTLHQVLAGEDVGTLFLPSRRVRLHARQRYLAFFAEPQGEIIVDSGAEEALIQKGKSLLPRGVLGLRGCFAAGSAVRIVNPARRELGRGVVNYSYEELSRICGADTAELEAKLGHAPQATEVIHRNSMVIL